MWQPDIKNEERNFELCTFEPVCNESFRQQGARHADCTVVPSWTFRCNAAKNAALQSLIKYFGKISGSYGGACPLGCCTM
jgi:hypothetical protein